MEKRSPWAWIPSLYFAEGLPYVVVMTLSVIMYKRLGVSNTDIALFTSLFSLGDQAHLEPVRRLDKNEALVDLWHAVIDWWGNGWCGVCPSRGFLSAVYLGFLLVDGV